MKTYLNYEYDKVNVIFKKFDIKIIMCRMI